MPTKDYIPHTDADFVVWLQSFSSKLTAHAATLGITPAEITQFSNDAADAANKLTDLQNTKTALQSLTQSKNILFAEIEKRVRDKAVIIKRNPNYTSVIGEDFGVVPAATGLGKSLNYRFAKAGIRNIRTS